MSLLRRAILASFLLQTMLPPLPAFGQAPVNLRERATEYVLETGLMARDYSGSFRGGEAMNRMDFLRILIDDIYSEDNRTQCFSDISSHPGRPPRYTHLFTDIERGSPDAGALCVGMLAGLVNGRRNGSFGPREQVSFAEAAKWITKAYGIAPRPSLRRETRVPWYESYRYAVAKRSAVPQAVKSPMQGLTRADAAELLYGLRAEKPLYGFRYPSDRQAPRETSTTYDFNSSPFESVKIKFVIPYIPPAGSSEEDDETLFLVKKIDPSDRLTARTRRKLIREGKVLYLHGALTEEQKSTSTVRRPVLRPRQSIGRDFHFIDPRTRPTARSIHQAAEARYRSGRS